MSKSIPEEVKNEVLERVEAFNKEHDTAFQMTFRGRFAYLSKTEKQQVEMANMFRQIIAQKMGIPIKQLPVQEGSTIETKLGRLEYKGQMDN
jgi:hypothetical protein